MTQSVDWGPWVYGEDGVSLDDAAEAYHEASRLTPVAVDHRVRGAVLLERSDELRRTVARATARRPGAATVPLPASPAPTATLADAIASRRSARAHGPGALRLGDLAWVLEAGYGVTGGGPGHTALRTVPSAGALYPLDLYVAATRVDGLATELHHFDPLRGVLEAVRPISPAELEPLTPYPDVLRSAAAVVAVAASFWRSRFKYGQRGYRFALLEAGHVAQNILLAAAALDLAAVPLGGFFDRQVNAFLEIDGLHEAALYLLPLGPREER